MPGTNRLLVSFLTSVLVAAAVAGVTRIAEAQPYCQTTVTHPTYGTFYDCQTASQPPVCSIYYITVKTTDTPVGELRLRWQGGTCRHAQAALYDLDGTFLNLWTLRHSTYPAGNTLGLPLESTATQRWARILNDRSMLVRAMLWRNLWVSPDVTGWY